MRGAAPKDSDNDGMPDEWETAHGLDSARPNANGRDLDPRYDNIEVYVNALFVARERENNGPAGMIGAIDLTPIIP